MSHKQLNYGMQSIEMHTKIQLKQPPQGASRAAFRC